MFLPPLLLPLLLLVCVSPFSLSLQPADGAFRGWQITDVAPLASTGVAYVLDSPRYIRAVNSSSGMVLPQSTSIDNARVILAIAADGFFASQRVYALMEPSYFNFWDVDLWLVAMTADLQFIGNVSLAGLNPPLDRYDQMLSNTLPIDSNGDVYYVRRLYNGTVLVHVITPDSKQIRTWTAPLPGDQFAHYIMAIGPDDTLYFQTDYYYRWMENDRPRALYVLSTDGVLQSAVNLSISSDTCRSISAMAVSRRTGNIALACGNSIELFRSSGAPVPTFSYSSVLPRYSLFSSLLFDPIDRLLAVAAYGEYGIQVVSSVSGDLLSDWNSRVPTFYYSRALVYEAWSRSLVAFPYFTDQPAVRVDADTGALVQEYRLAGRLGGCYTLASNVGSSGDLYLLLQCWDEPFGGYWSVGRVVLHAMSPAGRVRREVVLTSWSYWQLQTNTLIVCEDKQRFFVVAGEDWDKNQVVAIAFNGTILNSFNDTRMGFLGPYNTHLLRVNDNTLAVLDGYHDRIALVDLDNGDFFGNITFPPYTTVLAVAYDGQSWYRSEMSFTDDYTWTNISINQYADDGSVTAQYGVANRQFDMLTIAGDGDRRRLYALDRYEGTVAWWKIQPQQQQHHTTPRAHAKRHSAREDVQLPAARQPHDEREERFQAAKQAREQQWQDELQKREENGGQELYLQMRASRTQQA